MIEPPFIRNDIYRGPEGGDVSYYLQNVRGAQRSQGSRLHGTQGVVQRCSAWMDKDKFDQLREDCDEWREIMRAGPKPIPDFG